MLKLPVEELLCVTMTTRLLHRWNGLKNRNRMSLRVKIWSVLVVRLVLECNQSRGWRGFSNRLIFSQHGQHCCCCFSSCVPHDVGRVLGSCLCLMTGLSVPHNQSVFQVSRTTSLQRSPPPSRRSSVFWRLWTPPGWLMGTWFTLLMSTAPSRG